MVICWRSGRYVVSVPFGQRAHSGLYEPVRNWQALEAEARQAAEDAHQGGPFVFPCPPDLAQRAATPAAQGGKMPTPGAPAAPPMPPDLRTVQRSLFEQACKAEGLEGWQQ